MEMSSAADSPHSPSVTVSHVPVSTQGRTAVVTLDRPDAGNAMDTPLLVQLTEALRSLTTDPELRGVLVTGAGRAFCLGGDLRAYHRAMSDPQFDAVAYGDRLTGLLSEVVLTIRSLGCPVLAAVNGQAAGAGFSLALACDLRIASRRASFHFAYGAIGASTDAGMAWFLPRVVGHARALELLLEQPVLRPPQALEEGLVGAVVDPADLVDAGLRRLEELAQAAPHAIRSAKRLLDRSLSTGLADHLELERADFAAGVASRDMRRGVTSLLAGEWPEFRGE